MKNERALSLASQIDVVRGRDVPSAQHWLVVLFDQLHHHLHCELFDAIQFAVHRLGRVEFCALRRIETIDNALNGESLYAHFLEKHCVALRVALQLHSIANKVHLKLQKRRPCRQVDEIEPTLFVHGTRTLSNLGGRHFEYAATLLE